MIQNFIPLKCLSVMLLSNKLQYKLEKKSENTSGKKEENLNHQKDLFLCS